jgi:hypothetical protein
VKFQGHQSIVGWRVRRPLLLVTALFLLLLAGCGGSAGKPKEYAYVSAPHVVLRDRVAAVFDKMGTVHNGEQVEVLEKSKRFIRVRSPRNEIGWMELRYVVSQQVYDQFQKLAAEHAKDPLQAVATARFDVNLHVTADREGEHYYQLKEGQKVQVLMRTASPKPHSMAPVKLAKDVSTPPLALEDWWLVRDDQDHVGWLLARMIDEDVPLEIAQYAEGQRIVAYFVLNQVPDQGKQVAQYLVALTEPKDGQRFDFNQIRVFTWNLRRHRYETAYRERKLVGVLPIRVGKDTFDKEGVLPTFTVRTRDENDAVEERTYKLNGPIVRRVLAPGEQPKPAARPAATRTRASRRHR